MVRPHVDPVEVKFQRILGEGNLDELLSLLHQQPDLANRELPGGWTPLQTVINSSRADRIEFLKALISAGADVNGRSRFFTTPLIADVASRGDVAAASVLVVQGADLNAKDSFGRTPLDNAAFLQHLEVARLLITSGAQENLWDAAFVGDARVADNILRENPALLEQRGKMPAITPFDAALLHRAKAGDDGTIDVMLKYKSRLSFFEAAALGRIEVLRSLVAEFSRIVESEDATGRTALDWALLEHQRDAALFLFDKGATPTTAELVRAIRNSDADTVKLLLAHNVDKDQFIPGEGTPHTIAFLSGQYEIADLLSNH